MTKLEQQCHFHFLDLQVIGSESDFQLNRYYHLEKEQKKVIQHLRNRAGLMSEYMGNDLYAPLLFEPSHCYSDLDTEKHYGPNIGQSDLLLYEKKNTKTQIINKKHNNRNFRMNTYHILLIKCSSQCIQSSSPVPCSPVQL